MLPFPRSALCKFFFYLKFCLFFKNIHKIMAKVKTIFVGANNSNTNFNELECYFEDYSNNIIITILDYDKKDTVCIELDKSTAVRLSKELRRQIALIKGEEINNG